MRFLKRLFAAIILLGIFAFAFIYFAGTSERAVPEVTAGYHTTQISVPHRDELVSLHVWYPTKAALEPKLVGQNPLFYGFYAQVDAPPVAGKLPVVVLSHGSGGNAVALGWLASYLATKGMIVAAPNHPGTMSRDSDPFQTVKIWQRPQDLSAVLDALGDAPPLGIMPDLARVGVIGFSLGGHSALSISGIEVSKQGFIDYCDQYPDKIDCGWMNAAGVDFSAIDQALYEQSNKDQRVRATVAIDAALPLAIKPESAAFLDHPALLINLGAPQDIANGMRLDNVAKTLPRAQYRSVPDAYHFSFINECSLFGFLMIAVAGEENICSDIGMRDRGEIHKELQGTISAFLSDALGVQ